MTLEEDTSYRLFLWGSDPKTGGFRDAAVCWVLEGPGEMSRDQVERGPSANGIWVPALMLLLKCVEKLPSNARLQLYCEETFGSAFSKGWLTSWAASGFKKKPEVGREKWKELWELLAAKNIEIEHVAAARGGEEWAILDRLASASKHETGSKSRPDAPAPGDPDEYPLPKEDSDALMQRALAKDPF